MTITFINTGTAPNSGDGDTLRTAFNKVNANFSTLYNGAINQLVQRDTPPVPASTTTLWYDTVSGRTYVYYGGSWIDASPSEQSGSSPYVTTSTIGQYTGYISSVGLYDSNTGIASSTITHVSSISFDTQSAFTVEDLGHGSVLVGMNSTFKYIEIAHANTLTAVGLDTLTFIAGNGITLATDDTPSHQSITISTIFPADTTSSVGFLYDDGSGNLSWQMLSGNMLENGTSTFTLNSNGSVRFNDGTNQTTAYVPPTQNMDNYAQQVVFVSNTGTLHSSPALGLNPQMGLVFLQYLQVGNDMVVGPVTAVSALTNTGSGYLVTGTNIVTTGGQGTGLTVNYNSAAGHIVSFSVNNPGMNYHIGDLISITGGTTTATFTITNVNAPGYQGYISFPDNSQQTTAWTGTVAYSNITGVPYFTTSASFTTTNVSVFVNDIKYVTSGSNISVFNNNAGYITTASLAGYITTSTLNQLVSASSLVNNGYTATLTTAGNFILPGGLIIDYRNTPTVTITATSGGGLIASDVSAVPLTFTTVNSGTTYAWKFNPDGSITWPDGSIQASATTATSLASSYTNKIFYGSEILQVLQNGGVQFPDGSIQNTAYLGTSFASSSTTAVSLLNGSYKLRPVGVPSNLAGSPGDVEGDIAADSNYLYYCFGTYVDNNFPVYTVTTATNVNYIDILQAGAPVPQIGWEIHDPIGGPLMTITNVTSGLFGPTQIPYWRLSETSYFNSYNGGLEYLLVIPNIAEPGWNRVPWKNAESEFVNTSTAVTIDNVSAQMILNPDGRLKVSSVSGVFTATYSLTTFYAGQLTASSNNNITFNTTGNILGGHSTFAGDKAEVILTIPATNNAYRITAITGIDFANNFISIERLK